MAGGDEYLLGRDLAQTPLANVLATALKLKVNGELLIRHAQGENRIYFKSGLPSGTQVMHSFKPFGRMLIEMGWITESQYEAAVVEMEKGKRQGEALVGIGALTPERLDEALKLHQVRNLVEIARLRSGTLIFNSAVSTAPSWASEVAPNALHVLRLVLAVPESEAVCQSLFDRVGMDAFLVIPPHLVPTSSHFDFDAEEQTALQLLQSPVTVKQFFARSHLAQDKARGLVAVLLVTNLLVSPGRAVPEGAAPLLPKSDDEARARRRRMREKSITNLGGIIGRPPPPGYVPRPPSIDLPEMAESGPVEFSLSADERQLKQLIEEKAKLLPTLDAYGKLGLPKSATRDQIKTAFVHAAKVFHPDHLPPSLAALAAQQRDVFTAIKEAYDSLMQGPGSAASSASPSAPTAMRRPPTNSPAVAARARDDEALTLFRQGEQALKMRDYAAAAESFHQAFDLSPRGDYLACEAWALFTDPARKSNQKQARELLERAMATYPDSERVAQYAGTVARIDGNMTDASRWLRRAAAINPKNGEVASELHLLELRRRQSR